MLAEACGGRTHQPLIQGSPVLQTKRTTNPTPPQGNNQGSSYDNPHLSRSWRITDAVSSDHMLVGKIPSAQPTATSTSVIGRPCWRGLACPSALMGTREVGAVSPEVMPPGARLTHVASRRTSSLHLSSSSQGGACWAEGCGASPAFISTGAPTAHEVARGKSDDLPWGEAFALSRTPQGHSALAGPAW